MYHWCIYYKGTNIVIKRVNINIPEIDIIEHCLKLELKKRMMVEYTKVETTNSAEIVNKLEKLTYLI